MSVSNTSFASHVSDSVHRAFDFTVDKFPLSGPDGLSTSHYGLFRSDTGENVGPAVKSGYFPHQTEHVANACAAAAVAFGDGQCEVECSWWNYGHRVVIAPPDSYRRSIVGTDTVWPRMMLRAPYGRAMKMDVGLYRDACKNLQMVRSVARTSIDMRLVHRASFADNFEATVESLASLAKSFDNIYDVAVALNERTVAVDEFIGTLYPIPDNATERTRNKAIERASGMVRRLIDERTRLGQASRDPRTATLWEMVNQVTAYVQHDKRRRGRVSPLERALMATDDSESAAAWDYAVSLST